MSAQVQTFREKVIKLKSGEKHISNEMAFIPI